MLLGWSDGSVDNVLGLGSLVEWSWHWAQSAFTTATLPTQQLHQMQSWLHYRHSRLALPRWKGNCVALLRGEWAIFSHAGSESVDRMWSAREKNFEILWQGWELNPGNGEDRSWDTFILPLIYHDWFCQIRYTHVFTSYCSASGTMHGPSVIAPGVSQPQPFIWTCLLSLGRERWILNKLGVVLSRTYTAWDLSFY